jgi:hypothetical protein
MVLTAMKQNNIGINVVLISGLISLPMGLYADELDVNDRQGPRSAHGSGQQAGSEMRAAGRAKWQAMSAEEREAAKAERQQRRNERRQELENMTPEERQQARAEHRPMSAEEREAAKAERQQRWNERRQELENMTPEERQQARAEHRREMKKRRNKKPAGKRGNRSRREGGAGELKAMDHPSMGRD